MDSNGNEQNKTKKLLKSIKKCLQISVLLAIVMAIAATIHSLFVHGTVIIDNLFNAGLLAGTIMAGFGILKTLAGAFSGVGRLLTKSDKLLDRSTFKERAGAERATAQMEGYEYIFIGLGTVLLTGILQAVFFVIL